MMPNSQDLNKWTDPNKPPPPDERPPELLSDSAKAVNEELAAIQAKARALRTPEVTEHMRQLKKVFTEQDPMPALPQPRRPSALSRQPSTVAASAFPTKSMASPIIQANADGSIKSVAPPVEDIGEPLNFIPFPDGSFVKYAPRPAPKNLPPGAVWNQKFLLNSHNKPIAVVENARAADLLCSALNVYLVALARQQAEDKAGHEDAGAFNVVSGDDLNQDAR